MYKKQEKKKKKKKKKKKSNKQNCDRHANVVIFLVLMCRWLETKIQENT